jgi:hypothetical protein
VLLVLGDSDAEPRDVGECGAEIGLGAVEQVVAAWKKGEPGPGESGGRVSLMPAPSPPHPPLSP